MFLKYEIRIVKGLRKIMQCLPWFVLNEVVKDELINDDLKLTIYQYEWFQNWSSLFVLIKSNLIKSMY